MANQSQVQKVYGLSPIQEGILVQSLLDPDPALYFKQLTFTVHGRLEPGKFRESLGILIGRHENLRTSFVHQKVRRPVQVVLKERPAPFHFEDISAMAEAQRNAYWENYQEQDRRSGFNLVEDPLIRLGMIQTEAETYQVIWSFHPMIIDDWCLGIVIREFFQIYQSLLTGQPLGLEPAPPFSDYIQWLERQDRAAACEYWRQYLAEYLTDLSQPQKGADSQPNGYQPAESGFIMTEDLSVRLRQTASQFHVTLNTILQTAWGILLQKYYQAPDLVFGAVISGRPPEIGNLNQRVGLFTNTIPVRIHWTPGVTVLQLLKEFQRAGLEAEKYGYFSLTEIQNQSSLKQNLIKSLYIFQNYPSLEELAAQISGRPVSGAPLPFTVTDFQIKEQTNYDFNLLIQPGDPISAKIYYNADAYPGDWAQDIGRDYTTILEGILGAPELEISALINENADHVPSPWNGGRKKAPVQVAAAKTLTVEPIPEYQRWGAPEVSQNQFQPAPSQALAMCKLPIRFPHEVTTYLHYFLALVVILADERLWPWYYENYINIFSTVSREGRLRLDYLLCEFTRSQFLLSIRVPYELLGDLPEIIAYLIDKMNHSYYAIIHVDEYYLPNKASYRKNHYVHASLIYGYDNASRRLMTVGFEQKQLAAITIDYDQFSEAFESGKAYFRETAPWAEYHAIELLKFRDHSTEYPFSLNRFLAGLDGYLSAAGDDSVIYSYGLRNENIAYGSAVYDEVVHGLENLLNHEINIDYLVFHFLAEHKRGIWERLQFVGTRYQVSGGLWEMIEAYDSIVKEFEAIRRKSLELSYAIGQSRVANLSKVISETIQRIGAAQAQERLLLEEISRRLKLLR